MRSFILLLLALALSPPHALSEQGNDRVIIVLDASGSMWGQINAEPKMGIAKNVVQDLVKDWDDSIELGLTVYGHRRKGDCNDIESVVPVSKVRSGLIEEKIKDINPKGKTPLSQAVMMAADELKFTEERATVILVSDGIETCDFDPCEVATQLESNGVDFTAHVIGFDIQEEQAKEQLKCLAENTGGKMMSASDAASLKSSLDEAIKEVSLSRKNNVELVAVHESGGEPLMNVAWEVVNATAPDGKVVAMGRGATPKYTLEPGKYIAKVRSLRGKAQAEQEFEVLADKLMKQEVVLASEGTVKLIAVTEEGGKPLAEVAWTVDTPGTDMEKGKNVAWGRGSQPEYTLLPGTYVANVRSQKGKATAQQEVKVVAGKKITYEVLLAEEGIVKLLAVNSEGGDPLDEVAWNVDTLGSPMKKGETIAWGRGSQPEYRLLPGMYVAHVRSTKGKAVASQEIQVIPGEKNTIEVLLEQEGVIKLLAVNEAGGKPLDEVYWNVETIPTSDMEKSENVAYGRGSQPEYKLLPGKYLAKVTSRRGKASTEQEIEVVAGQKTTTEVVMAAEGLLDLKAVHANGGKAVSDVFWEVFTIVPEDSMDNPEKVAYGKGNTPAYKLLPGKYLAKVKSRLGMATAEMEVEVSPNKRSRVEVLIPQEGEVQLSAVKPNGDKPNRIFWEVITLLEPDSMEKPEVLRRGGGASPKYRMLPGKYVARATYDKESYQKEIEVKPGKITREELTLSREG